MKKLLMLLMLVLFLAPLATANAGLIGVDPVSLKISGKTGAQFYWGDGFSSSFSIVEPSPWSDKLEYLEGVEIKGLKAKKGQILSFDIDEETIDGIVYFAMFNANGKIKKRGKFIFDSDNDTWKIKGVGKKEWNSVFPFGYTAASEFSKYASLAVGEGENTNGVAAVPEPATMLLLGAGLIGLACCSRRKFKAN